MQLNKSMPLWEERKQTDSPVFNPLQSPFLFFLSWSKLQRYPVAAVSLHKVICYFFLFQSHLGQRLFFTVRNCNAAPYTKEEHCALLSGQQRRKSSHPHAQKRQKDPKVFEFVLLKICSYIHIQEAAFKHTAVKQRAKPTDSFTQLTHRQHFLP